MCFILCMYLHVFGLGLNLLFFHVQTQSASTWNCNRFHFRCVVLLHLWKNFSCTVAARRIGKYTLDGFEPFRYCYCGVLCATKWFSSCFYRCLWFVCCLFNNSCKLYAPHEYVSYVLQNTNRKPIWMDRSHILHCTGFSTCLWHSKIHEICCR